MTDELVAAIDLDAPPDTPPDTSNDPQPTEATGVVARGLNAALVRTVAVAIVLPLALYFVMRPENFGLTPNSLDPLFYTGYGINFDDLLNAVGGRHYFVSRWSAYYPLYIADAVGGPFVGRLLLRWALAGTILLFVWRFGSWRGWRRPQMLLVGTLVITMPMFVRAFFTDYVEYFVVAVGICLIILCLRERQTWISSVVVGALAGLIVVANPIAVTAVAFPLLTALIVGNRTMLQRFVYAVSVFGGAFAVVMAGLLLFRWRYGIDNVYQPTFDFIRTYQGRDGLKSPRVDWLWHFSWLWATPIVLLAAVGMRWRRAMEFSRVERAALILCAVQYAYQWIDQFVRDGNGLEISYYWSFSYPTFAIALAVVIGRLTMRTPARVLVGATVGWVVFMTLGLPSFANLPSGAAFFALAALAVAGVVWLSLRRSFAASILVLVTIGWLQIGAPHYDPSAYFASNVSPRYDILFRQAGDLSETIYREAVWFEQEMDKVPNDASTSFVAVGGWSSSISGLYAPHVVGHLVGIEENTRRLTPTAIAEIRGGTRPIVAVFGPEPEVARMIATFPRDLGVGSKVLDVTHDRALHYRLVVYDMPDAGYLPFTWTADILPTINGSVVGTSVEVDLDGPAGFVTYGPYAPLQAGRYELTLNYSSDRPTNEVIGSFDVASPEQGPAGQIELTGSDGQPASIRLPFQVPESGGRWEFRTFWSGVGGLTIDSITLSAT